MALDPIVALEVGTTKVRALVGEANDEGHIKITGVGDTLSRGVRKGEITDVENASRCVHAALKEAEEQANITINQVHLVISGGHIQSMINRGSVPVEGEQNEVFQDDIEHVMETAKAVSLDPDRQVLHTVNQLFYVDDQGGVINPMGMHGAKLALDMLLLHGVRNRLKNVIKVVSNIPMHVEDVVFSPLCCALAVLTPDEKERGVALIDLGGGTTDFLVYAGGTIADAGCIAVGGDHVTNDIARGLRIPTSMAESLKLNEGSALLKVSARSRRVTVKGGGTQQDKFVRLSDLHTIMHARMEELVGLIRTRFDRAGLLDQLGAGVVLTGGGSAMNEITELVEQVLGVPCTVGKPHSVSGLARSAESPEYAAPIGLLRYAMKNMMRDRASEGIAKRIKRLLFS